MNKRGITGDLVTELIVFTVFSLIFLAALFIFIGNAGKGANVYEQMYAKKIALAIDAAKPGMIITFNISNAYKFNNQTFKILEPTNSVGSVNVILGKGSGYTYTYFSDYKVKGEIDKKDKNSFVITVEDKNAV